MAEILNHFGDSEVSVPLQVIPIINSGPPVFRIDTANLDPFIEGLFVNGQFFTGTEMNAGAPAGTTSPPMFGEEWWYGRVHIVPNSFILGTVLTGVQRSWEYYNGKTSVVTVTSLVGSGVSGFTIIAGDVVTPFTVNPGASEEYTVEISADGPDVIDGTYTYTNEAADVVSVTFTGQRLILMAFMPEKPIREQWDFLTDILTQMDGVETQRRAMRDRPRQTLTYRWRFDEIDAVRFENQIFDWNIRTWAIIDWTQFVTLTAQADPNDTSILVTDTTDIDFRAGLNESVAMWVSDSVFLTAEPSLINATSIDLANGLTGVVSFPVGTRVYPVRTAFGSQNITAGQFKTNVRDYEMTFRSASNFDWGDLAAVLPTTYRSLPVFDRLLFTPGGNRIPVRYEFGGVPWDPDGIGRQTQKSFRKTPRVTQPIRFYMDDRLEYVAIRGLVHGTFGRQKSFWMQSFLEDFVVGTDQPAGVTLTVELANYTAHIFSLSSNMRKDIAIEYVDGVVDLREITATLEGVTTEDLTISPSSSQTLTAANIRRISYLHKVRFGSDAFIFVHQRRDYVVLDTTIVHIEQ